MKSHLRILCVDNDDTCELLAATLGISDIEVKSANTVAAAWQLAQTESFDLYLLETRLPDGDGFDLCRRLHKFALQTPIVFYSCEAYPIDRQKGLAAGAVAYLIKPYFDDLAATVLQIITNTKKTKFRIHTCIRRYPGQAAEKHSNENLLIKLTARQ